MTFQVDRFDPERHIRDGFVCGVGALDRYLTQQAGQDARRSLSTLFCLTENDDPRVIAFYTLSPSSLALHDIPASDLKQLPSYPQIPASLIGRLAVETAHQGIGLGRAMLFDAIARCANDRIAAWAIMVDPIDERAAGFYAGFGFARSESGGLMFIPTHTAAKLLPTADPSD